MGFIRGWWQPPPHLPDGSLDTVKISVDGSCRRVAACRLQTRLPHLQNNGIQLLLRRVFRGQPFERMAVPADGEMRNIQEILAMFDKLFETSHKPSKA
jgi:hypothetical protein